MSNASILVFCLSWCLALPVPADEVRVAVASNFVATLERLAGGFAATSGHRVQISAASTGKHYAQIRNGAAFDVFLAADAERPARLEREGVGVTGSRFTYAEGRLVLWAPAAANLDDPAAFLTGAPVARLAIAHPDLAPYGRAARQALEHWGLWRAVQPRLVRGENIGQTFQYVATGNAQAGFVALSQLLLLPEAKRGGHAPVPADGYDPIVQQALLLRPGAAAEAFLDYLRSDAARGEIVRAGYAVPEGG